MTKAMLEGKGALVKSSQLRRQALTQGAGPGRATRILVSLAARLH
jgi:hypothetical protein